MWQWKKTEKWASNWQEKKHQDRGNACREKHFDTLKEGIQGQQTLVCTPLAPFSLPSANASWCFFEKAWGFLWIPGHYWLKHRTGHKCHINAIGDPSTNNGWTLALKYSRFLIPQMGQIRGTVYPPLGGPQQEPQLSIALTCSSTRIPFFPFLISFFLTQFPHLLPLNNALHSNPCFW